MLWQRSSIIEQTKKNHTATKTWLPFWFLLVEKTWQVLYKNKLPYYNLYLPLIAFEEDNLSIVLWSKALQEWLDVSSLLNPTCMHDTLFTIYLVSFVFVYNKLANFSLQTSNRWSTDSGGPDYKRTILLFEAKYFRF